MKDFQSLRSSVLWSVDFDMLKSSELVENQLLFFARDSLVMGVMRGIRSSVNILPTESNTGL